MDQRKTLVFTQVFQKGPLLSDCHFNHQNKEMKTFFFTLKFSFSRKKQDMYLSFLPKMFVLDKYPPYTSKHLLPVETKHPPKKWLLQFKNIFILFLWDAWKRWRDSTSTNLLCILQVMIITLNSNIRAFQEQG